jgi:hypothetical protein
MGIGREIETIDKDEEGNMRDLGKIMAWLLKKIRN